MFKIEKRSKGRTLFYLFGKNIWTHQKKNFHKDLDLIKKSISDPKGFGHLSLLLHQLEVLKKYEHIFFKVRPNDVIIDCGAHAGRFIDVCLHLQAEVYAYEPNPDLFINLERKYKNNPTVHLYNQGVWDKEGELPFFRGKHEQENFDNFSQNATICNSDVDYISEQGQIVKIVDLTIVIKEILNKHSYIHILKLDVEGAEFEIIEKLISEKLHEKIGYIFCETHARLFKDGKSKLAKIETLIKENGIKNIYLDWI